MKHIITIFICKRNLLFTYLFQKSLDEYLKGSCSKNDSSSPLKNKKLSSCPQRVSV